MPTLATDTRFAASERDNARVAPIVRANQFRGAILSKVTNSVYRDHLPTVPKIGAALSNFCKPLHDMNTIWLRVNGHQSELSLGEPLTLQGDYTEVMFADDIEQLAVLTNAAARPLSSVGFARSHRNTNMASIYERLKQYRAGAEADLPPDSAARQHLPRLSPDKGTTPPALGATGVWDAATATARLSW